MQERAKIDLGPSENIYTQGPNTRQRQWKVSSEVKDKRGDTSYTHVTQTTFKQSLMSLFLLPLKSLHLKIIRKKKKKKVVVFSFQLSE